MIWIYMCIFIYTRLCIYIYTYINVYTYQFGLKDQEYPPLEQVSFTKQKVLAPKNSSAPSLPRGDNDMMLRLSECGGACKTPNITSSCLYLPIYVYKYRYIRYSYIYIYT